MDVLFFILACYGITLLIVQSRIMSPVREIFNGRVNFLYHLLNCMMCTGFWVGLFTSIIYNFSPSYITLNGGGSSFLYNLLDAAFTSGCIWLIFLVQLNLERYVKDEI